MIERGKNSAGRKLRSQNPYWVWFKSEDARQPAFIFSCINSGANDLLVPNMQAVENTQGKV